MMWSQTNKDDLASGFTWGSTVAACPASRCRELTWGTLMGTAVRVPSIWNTQTQLFSRKLLEHQHRKHKSTNWSPAWSRIQTSPASKSICSASSLTHNTGSVCHMNSLIHIVQWAHSAVVTNTNHKGSCSYIKPQHSCMLGNRFINLNLRLFCSDKSNRSSGAGCNEKLRLSELLRGWSHETYNFIRRNLPQEVVQFPASR